MSAFTGDGVLDSIGKALGSLFGGSSGGIKDLADDVKEFADVDAQGLKQIGEGLQGIANFLEAMDGAHLKVFPNLFHNLQNSYKNTKNSTVKWIQKPKQPC